MPCIVRVVRAVAVLVLMLAGSSVARADVSPAIVIVAGNFWDGLSDQPAGPMEILVEAGKISEIGLKVSRPAGAKIVSLPGHTVMPGFIDTHVHVTLRPEYEDKVWNLSASYMSLLGAEALGRLLDHGFTTVRDVADVTLHGFSTVDLKHGLDQGLITGPRLIPSGHMISARGGHGDGTPLMSPDTPVQQYGLADGVDEIRKEVRTEASRGAQWIKFAGTGGFSSPADDPAQVPYSQEEMNVLVETARDLGLPVTTHAYGDEGIRRAVLAGVRSIEHANLASPDTLKMISERGIFVVPTQMAVVRQARLIDDDAFWAAADKPPYVRAKYRKYASQLMDSARHLAASDVKIAFGTDIGTFSFDQNNAAEFGEMVANGLSPLRALKAGTSVAAELLQLDDVGSLAVGKTADIVAMPGNPFADISVTERVDFVMKSGVIHKSN
jgi:imidazolonepropionase-like amidohydrolase